MRVFPGFLLMVCALDAQPVPKPCLYRIAEDFVPMTDSERARIAEDSIVGPSAFLFVAAKAGLGQGHNQPREWGQDAAGFGLRFGSVYAEHFIGQMFEQGAAYKLHEDNRYFASGKRNPVLRLGYAVASTVLTRHDDGSQAISISAIGGAATGAFISRAWQPRSTTSVGDAAVSFGVTMAVRAGFNVLREFSPRFFGRILN